MESFKAKNFKMVLQLGGLGSCSRPTCDGLILFVETLCKVINKIYVRPKNYWVAGSKSSIFQKDILGCRPKQILHNKN